MYKLRSNIQTDVGPKAVIFRSGYYQLELPKSWAEETPEIIVLAQARQLAKSTISGQQNMIVGVLNWLNKAGFLIPENKDSYTLEECRNIYDGLINQWYEDYYAHPVWKRARAGELSRKGLLAWLIHNYHISKAAGITDAKASLAMPTRELKLFFRQNCLEEYWHCEAFYFVRHSNLHVNDGDIKAYLPLPSSLAFEQHATRSAEVDWMANVLISYFQESSIKFYDDAVCFYKEVEERYNIPGMFDTWIQHMSLDLGHDHATELGNLLMSGDTISKTDFLRSVDHASKAFKFLICALDEIIAEDQKAMDVSVLRSAVKNGVLNAESNNMLDINNLNGIVLELGNSPFELYAKLNQINITQLSRVLGEKQLNLTDQQYFRDEFISSCFRALNMANSHDEVILFGKLAEAGKAQELDELECVPSLFITSISNFLDRTAYTPRIYAFLLLHLFELSYTHKYSLFSEFPINAKGISRIKNYLADTTFSRDELDMCCNTILQFNELIARYDDYMRRDTLLAPFI